MGKEELNGGKAGESDEVNRNPFPHPRGASIDSLLLQSHTALSRLVRHAREARWRDVRISEVNEKQRETVKNQ